MAEDASAANDFAHAPNLSKEEIALRYSKWAQGAQYEQDLSEENFKGPTITADVLAELFPDEDSRGDVYILDVAAGSGFAGEKLVQKGFQKLDALEPSEGMLNLAISKGIYTRTFQTFLNGPTNCILSGSYDVALICGGMGEGHIPCSGLDELIRVVRPGGLAVIVMREKYLTSVVEYKDRLEPRMKELELEGKWSSVMRRVVPKYSFENNGVVFVFRVL
ncbi:methyltransferase-like protein 27 [Biomphalaria pfeifferi]|uniref:Methyltransferase-like protein 27 n=1 Tax=Biomphalaria pfeifferi TaxID=112525 RepID=A0AAD8F8V4_BIOPF|nr:methyltransferase-like protein 27 [Biomphalaria pfeifferi]